MPKKFTAIIAVSGYEDRLNGIDDEHDGTLTNLPKGFLPICAGERMITPEELNCDIAKKLGFDEEIGKIHKHKKYQKQFYDSKKKPDEKNHFSRWGMGSYWYKHKFELTGITCEKLTDKELFIGYNGKDDAIMWRERYVKTILQKYVEIKELCMHEGDNSIAMYGLTSGLICLLNDVFDPLEIGCCMKDKDYFWCPNTHPYDVDVLKSDKHKILIAEYDGESG